MSLETENHEARIRALESQFKEIKTDVLKLAKSLTENANAFMSGIVSNLQAHQVTTDANINLFLTSYILTAGILKEIIAQLPASEKNQAITDGLANLESSIDQAQAALNSLRKDGHQPPPPSPPPGK